MEFLLGKKDKDILEMTNNVEFALFNNVALFHYIVEEIILTVKLHEIYLELVIHCIENLTERKRNLVLKFSFCFMDHGGLFNTILIIPQGGSICLH